jgi:hypothetical protein
MPFEGAPLPGKGQKSEIRRVEHQLDGHKDDENIPPNHQTREANGKQNRVDERESILAQNLEVGTAGFEPDIVALPACAASSGFGFGEAGRVYHERNYTT